ncbi:unnamed protein product [Ophioblennius macclurei]
MSRWLKCTSMHFNTDWNKYDDRLMKAVERSEVDKVAAVLSKKGIIPTKLDVEGRSAFHLAATRGHLDCLNLILRHNVDVTASDATGKNALHLASRNGHSLCVQKLLQFNCPVGNMDLQGRTALHDAVMAGCPSSVKLLCDSGASVNACDFEGKTPLILATQMCHPQICQLLLERGADISVRDKQSKTSLILGCEFGCKDAVEVLLRGGAEVKAVDALGHDAYHYARLSKNQDLVSLVKAYLDKASRDKEAARMEQWKRQYSVERSEAAEPSRRDQVVQDLEQQNQNLQESLRKFHQEQKTLLDTVNMLQQQLTQEKSAAEDTQKEKEQLKVLLGSKERDEAGRSPETVKVQLRSTLGEYSGQSVIKGKENLVKQARSLDSEHNPSVSRSLSRTETSPPAAAAVGWDGPPELDALRHELDAVRRRQQAAEEETARLQSALTRKTRECQDLVQSREAVQKQADRQIQELEDALGDVQKRMLDSECKVKQLQAHVVAVKEHLGGQANEELRLQLQEVKAKYEGASAEVGRVRNRLKHSEKVLEEYKSSEGQLAAETDRLHRELAALAAERDELAAGLSQAEAHLKEAQQSKAGAGATVPAEKFDNMKNLLSNAVDEKERQLAELRDDYDRVLEEVADLHRRLDAPAAPGGGAGGGDDEEQQKVRAALEEQNASLKRKLTEVTAKSQALIREVEEGEEERELMREQMEELGGRMEAEFIPLSDHEEARRSMVAALEELEDKLVEADERCGKAEAQVLQLQAEGAADHQEQRRRAEEAEQRNGELTETLQLLQKRCEERDEECEALRRNLDGDYVPRQRHEQVRAELDAALQKAKEDTWKVEGREAEREEELKNVREGNDKLKERLDAVLLEMENDYVAAAEHRAGVERLEAAAAQARERADQESALHAAAREEVAKLTRELEAQKKELDTIQEVIQAKFVPLTAAEEKESSFSAQLSEMSARLQEAQEAHRRDKSDWESSLREKEEQRAEKEAELQKLASDLEEQKEEREQLQRRSEEASRELADSERRLQEEKLRASELQERDAAGAAQIQNLQERLKAELLRISTYDSELQSLQGAAGDAAADCKKAREAQQEEAQRAASLQKELQEQRGAKEALEAEVLELRRALREEEENSAQRAEDVSALQSELLRATQALEEARYKEEHVNEMKKEKRQLEEEVAGLGDKLLGLAQECEEAQRQAAQARGAESRARAEAEEVQEKGRAVEREVRELKERYDQSLSTIGDLQRRNQTSALQTEAKDKKISELLVDVERLKQALNGLSQLAYSSSAPKRHNVETLQAQIKSLQQQLADAERQHREVVSIYRTHLLSAAQGHMDEDVQAALLQIIRMRQEFVC